MPILAVDKESEVNTPVDKKYTDFMDEISSDELYEGLLAYGFFAEKLPPVFTAVPFFNYCKAVSDSFEAGWNEYITFRVMRNISIPRLMGIPNPFKYQRACAELRDNWDKIRAHFHVQTDGQSYRVSRIHVRKEYNEKRIFEMNYKNWRVDGNPESDLLVHDKGTSRFLVQADVSTCFPNIYTRGLWWEKKKQSKQFMMTLGITGLIRRVQICAMVKRTVSLSDRILQTCFQRLF